jgi:hypothetical protein
MPKILNILILKVAKSVYLLELAALPRIIKSISKIRIK